LERCGQLATEVCIFEGVVAKPLCSKGSGSIQLGFGLDGGKRTFEVILLNALLAQFVGEATCTKGFSGGAFCDPSFCKPRVVQIANALQLFDDGFDDRFVEASFGKAQLSFAHRAWPVRKETEGDVLGAFEVFHGLSYQLSIVSYK
jgi:hypothetical protein